MSVVGSYEISLEDEYDPVGILGIVVEYPWLLPLILIIVALLVGITVYKVRKTRR